jgi:GAF domain-containing protein
MRNGFLNFFSDPEDNEPSFIRLVQIILIVVIVANAGLFIVSTGIIIGTFEVLNIVTAGTTLLLEVIALVLAWRGRVSVAKFIVPVALLIAITYLAISGFGLRDTSVHAFPAIIVMAALLLKAKARYTITPLVLIGLALVALADMTGISSSPFAKSTGVAQVVTVGIFFLAASETLQLLISRLNESAAKARRNEQAQITANAELRALQASLEQRVAERTIDLEFANQRNEKRAKQFEAITQVARATVANQSLEEFLSNMVRLISKQFGFYHAGIFLLDQQREYAELRAANSEGGQRMLSRGHRLAIGQSGIVGYVAATGRARIALDVGDDAAFFNNPDLPSTRSEIALPLRVADQIIGILDVQSITSNAFQEEDVEVLSTLADQVAIGIQNALSYETTQKLLREAQQTSGNFLQESWKVLGAQREGVIGYHLIDNKVAPLTKPLSSNLVDQAMLSKTVLKEDGDHAMLAVPIRMRDEVIGVLDIRVPDEHEWDEDEVDIATAVAERLSLAIESILLLKSTQRRAEIERITADITSKIGATSQFDSILRTAAEELSRALGGSEVLVQLQSELLEKSAE